MRRALILVLVAACGGASASGDDQVDAGTSGDGGGVTDAPGCSIVLTFNPPQPIADPAAPIRATAQLHGALGVPDYMWTVQAPDGTGVMTTSASTDGSMVDFVAATAGAYHVYLDSGTGTFCPQGFAVLQVSQPGAQVADYRVRVTPNAVDGAPPQETIVQVLGGADVTRTLALDPGLVVTGQVKNGSTGVPAYLRFMPASSPNGYVEVFTDSTGHYSTRLLGQNHQVLVVPTVPGVAPAMDAWTPQTTTLAVGPGNLVTGTVKDGSGTPVAGAQVYVTGTVQSTLATTTADGSFSVRTSSPASSAFAVGVTPPPGRGLPALAANAVSGPTIAIQYANAPTCDLAATPVKRGSTLEPGAHVTITGLLANAATMNASSAGGRVQIAVTADGTGKLPSTLVPRSPLSSVVDLGGGDVAVASIDTSACAAQTISAPAATTVAGTMIDAASNPLPGGRIEAVPVGDLAAAGMPIVNASADPTGAFSLALATGGHYDITFSDPRAHSAPLPLTNVTAAGVPTTALLGKALKLSGDVSVIGNANPIIGASIQVFSLTANASQAPIAETATTQTSTYAVGIPDPGTM